jgi:preprotein translocase subunit SecG
MNTTPRAPAVHTLAERAAAACVVAVIAGLVLPMAALNSLGRAILAWLMFSLLIGFLLGTKSQVPVKKVVAVALLPSALVPLTYAAFWLVRFLGDWSKLGVAPQFGLGLSGQLLDVTSPVVLTVSLVILVILFIATLLVVSLASVGKRPLVLSIAQANKLGPDGFEHAQKVVLAVVGLAAVVSSVWLAVGS